MSNGWVRVTKKQPCPICGKTRWCCISVDGTAVICPRTPEGAKRNLGEAGYLHILRERIDTTPIRRERKRPKINPPENPVAWMNLAAGYHTELWMYDDAVDILCEELALERQTLYRLRVGWCGRYSAYSFPMRDHAGTIIGIRLRTRHGEKFCIEGSRNGLFMPFDLRHALAKPPVLFICEGPTDTGAMLELGFAAIGRPSATCGTEIIKLMVNKLCRPSVIIVADNDKNGVGLRGAMTLQSEIAPICRECTVIRPPVGKDARDWVAEGATQEDVVNVVHQAMED